MISLDIYSTLRLDYYFSIYYKNMLFGHNHIVKLIKNNFILKYLLKYMLILLKKKFKYILLKIKL